MIPALIGSRRRLFVTHAATALDAHGAVVTAGGRVLSVTALGEDIAAARAGAYAAADMISSMANSCGTTSPRHRADEHRRGTGSSRSTRAPRSRLRRRAEPASLAATRAEIQDLDVDEPQVAILMVKSNLPAMERPRPELTERGIRSETRVMSAHREPDVVADYAKNAKLRGIRVIIAGAGCRRRCRASSPPTPSCR